MCVCFSIQNKHSTYCCNSPSPVLPSTIFLLPNHTWRCRLMCAGFFPSHNMKQFLRNVICYFVWYIRSLSFYIVFWCLMNMFGFGFYSCLMHQPNKINQHQLVSITKKINLFGSKNLQLMLDCCWDSNSIICCLPGCHSVYEFYSIQFTFDPNQPENCSILNCLIGLNSELPKKRWYISNHLPLFSIWESNGKEEEERKECSFTEFFTWLV